MEVRRFESNSWEEVRVSKCFPAVDSYYAWLVTAAAVLCYSVSMGSWWTNGVFFVSLLEEFEHGRAVTGIVSTLTVFTYSVGGVPAGYMVNWWGCRVIGLVGAFCMGLSYVSSSIASSIWPIYLSDGFLKGLAGILLLQTSFAVVSKYHVKYRTLAISLVSCGSGVGTLCGVVFEFLTRRYGWRVACRLLGLSFVVLTSLGSSTYIPIRDPKTGSKATTKPLTSKQLISTTSFKFLLMSYFLNTYSLVNTYIIDFAQTRGLSSEASASLLLYWGVFDIVGKLLVGLWKSKDSGRLKILFAVFVLMSVMSWFIVLPLSYLPTFPVFVVYISIYGLCSGITWNLLATCAADVYGAENVPLCIGWAYTTHGPANLITFPLVGKIVDMSGGEYTQAFSVIAIIATLAGISSYFFMYFSTQRLRIQEMDKVFDKVSIEIAEQEEGTRGKAVEYLEQSVAPIKLSQI